MNLKLFLPAILLALCSFQHISYAATLPPSLPTICAPDTLADYELYGTGTEPLGCFLGANSLFFFEGFNFTPDANNGISPSGIELTPVPLGQGGGFVFCATPGTACDFGGPHADDITFSGGTLGLNFGVGYQFFMTTDPLVAQSDIGTDPPTGNVTITEGVCTDPTPILGGLNEGHTCANGFQIFTLTFPPDTSGSFPLIPPAQSGAIVALNFNIGPGSTLGALSTNFDVTDSVPEPITSLLGFGGLVAIGLIRRYRM